jgi:hypothetical protein
VYEWCVLCLFFAYPHYQQQQQQQSSVTAAAPQFGTAAVSTQPQYTFPGDGAIFNAELDIG